MASPQGETPRTPHRMPGSFEGSQETDSSPLQLSPSPYIPSTQESSSPSEQYGNKRKRTSYHNTFMNGSQRLVKSIQDFVTSPLSQHRDNDLAQQETESVRESMTEDIQAVMDDQENQIHILKRQVEKYRGAARANSRGTDRKHRELLASKREIFRLENEIRKLGDEHKTYQQSAEATIDEQKEQLKVLISQRDEAVLDSSPAATEGALQLAEAQNEIRNLQEKLEECKSKILRMHVEDRLSDTDVLQRYERLCEGVTNFVDTQVGETEKFLQSVTRIALGPVHAATLDRYFNGNMGVLAKYHPEAEALLAEMIVHKLLLERVLLLEDRFPDLDGSEADLLNAIDVHISKIASKDNPATTLWTPQCYEALLNNTNFRRRRDLRLAKAANAIRSIFGILLATTKKSGVEDHICQQLVKQAADFVDDIGTLSTQYRLEYPTEFAVPTGKIRGLRLNDMKNCTVIDATTLRKLKAEDTIVPQQDGLVGHLLVVISPRLIRLGQKEDDTLQLVAPKLLVDFYNEVQRGKKTSAA